LRDCNGCNEPGIRRVVEAFDCGALFEAVQFADGRILNPHFASYRLPRFKDVAQIKVVVIDRKDQPSFGAGETPIVGLASAVGNAIFAATGVRLRGLPMARGGIGERA